MIKRVLMFVFAPAPQAVVPVSGEKNVFFPVDRVYCVGRNYADHYKEKGKVIEIDGARSIEEVRQDCIAEIKKIWTVEEIPEEQLQQQEAQEEANKKASKCCLLI